MESLHFPYSCEVLRITAKHLGQIQKNLVSSIYKDYEQLQNILMKAIIIF